MGSSLPDGSPLPLHKDKRFNGFAVGTVEPLLIHSCKSQIKRQGTTHLKRVIVTPAVYGSFVRLYSVFRYPHWAGFTDYTSPYGVAVCYVVVRQLELPGHCDLPDHQAGTPYSEGTGPFCRVPLPQIIPTRLSLFN